MKFLSDLLASLETLRIFENHPYRQHLQYIQHPNLLLNLFEALGELRLHFRVAGRGYLLIELFALPLVVDDLAFGIRRIES